MVEHCLHDQQGKHDHEQHNQHKQKMLLEFRDWTDEVFWETMNACTSKKWKKGPELKKKKVSHKLVENPYKKILKAWFDSLGVSGG